MTSGSHGKQQSGRYCRPCQTRPGRWRALYLNVATAALLSAIALGTWIAIEATTAGPHVLRYRDLPGIDVSSLDHGQLAALLIESNQERCPCGCTFTLAGCRHVDPGCPLSRPILDGWVHEYREGARQPLEEPRKDEKSEMRQDRRFGAMRRYAGASGRRDEIGG